MARTHVATWSTMCFALLAAAGAEGLHFAFVDQTLGPFAAVANAGFLAPILLVLSLVFAVALGAWRGLGWLPSTPAEAIATLRDWGYRSEPLALADRTAAIFAGVVCAAAFFGASFAAGSLILGTVARPVLGLGLILGVQIALLAAAVAGFAVAYASLRAVLRAAARRLPRAVVAPLTYFGIGLALCVAAIVVVASSETGEHLPWHVLSAAVGFVLGGAVAWPLGRRWTAASAVTAGALLVATFLATVWMPPSQRHNRTIFTALSPIAAPLFGALEPRLDFDADGAIHLYGGRDCAPRDPKSHPGALERLNNGIDEDCSGADLTNALQIEEGARSYGKPKQVKGRPHIFLITTDSLSMDRTSLGRTDRDTTPNLATFARDAVVFDHAFALAPSTRLALPGLLAGVFNSAMPLIPEGGQPFGWHKDSPTIASTMRKTGYRTVQVIGDDYFSRRWKDGPSVGFDERDAAAARGAKDRDHTAPELTERVLAQIERAAKEKKPTFLWAHYYDHHHPFRPPADGEDWGSEKAEVFDSELNFADRHWGRVFEALAATFEPDEYIVVFTADHGEAFDEFHPKKHHGYDLHNPVLHVPLIIRTGTSAPRVDGLVTHADVAPTLADIVGAKRNPAWIGESLVPVLYDGAKPQKTVVYGLFYIPERVAKGRNPFARLAVRTNDLYFETDYDSDSERLTRWRTDPVGVEDISDSASGDASLLRHLAALELLDQRESEKALRGSPLDKDAPAPAPKAKKKRSAKEERP